MTHYFSHSTLDPGVSNSQSSSPKPCITVKQSDFLIKVFSDVEDPGSKISIEALTTKSKKLGLILKINVLTYRLEVGVLYTPILLNLWPYVTAIFLFDTIAYSKFKFQQNPQINTGIQQNRRCIRSSTQWLDV